MEKFKIVNPTIIGGFETVITAHDKNEAAHKAWQSLSDHITGNVPHFAFTMENIKTHELVSFQVEESPTGKYADYTISEVEINLTPKQEKEFREELSRLAKTTKEVEKHQSGGKHSHEHHKGKKRYNNGNDDDDDSSSSSSSSSSDDDLDVTSVYKKLKLFKSINNQKPIIYWWYSPVLYRLDRFYMPTFNAPLTPYVEINLSSAFLGQ